MEEKEITVTRNLFFENCENCGKEIRGSSEAAFIFNMKSHLAKHEKEKKIKDLKIKIREDKIKEDKQN